MSTWKYEEGTTKSIQSRREEWAEEGRRRRLIHPLLVRVLQVGLVQPVHTMVRVLGVAKMHACCGLVSLKQAHLFYELYPYPGHF